jgi:hypothetical protein
MCFTCGPSLPESWQTAKMPQNSLKQVKPARFAVVFWKPFVGRVSLVLGWRSQAVV